MLNINEVQSTNEVYVSGILNELEIVEGTMPDGRQYIRGDARIKVDQEVNGKVAENIIPVKMFSMRKKNNGELNPVYDRIANYRNSLTSIAAAESPASASKITVNGRLTESLYYSTKTGQVQSFYQIDGSFINIKREDDEEKATFKLSGVVGKMRPEIDRDGNETGRLIIQFIVVGYKGRANVIELIANDNAKAFIESHWEIGDTVLVTGVVNMSYKVITWTEEQGFGEPIKRTRTESARELIISGGSGQGFEEDKAYDSDDVATILAERTERIEEIKNKATKSAAKTTTKSINNFGF